MDERRRSLLELAAFVVVAFYALVLLVVALGTANVLGFATSAVLALLAYLIWVDTEISQWATFAGLVCCVTAFLPGPWLLPVIAGVVFTARVVELALNRRSASPAS